MTEDSLTMEDFLYNASTAASLVLEEAMGRHGPYDPNKRDWGPRCIAYALMPANGPLAATARKEGFAFAEAGEWVIFDPKTIARFFDFWIGDFINPVIEAAHAELLRSGEPVELF